MELLFICSALLISYVLGSGHLAVPGRSASTHWNTQYKGEICVSDDTTMGPNTNGIETGIGVTCCWDGDFTSANAGNVRFDVAGERPDCDWRNVTYDQAKALCEHYASPGPYRLCSREELHGSAGWGQGCQFDAKLVWSSTPCESDIDARTLDSALPIGFIRNGKLTADDAASNDCFGSALSISADGNTMAIGAYMDDDDGDNSGSVYVFKYTVELGWTQQQKLTANVTIGDPAAGDWFGKDVSISADGKTIAIGAELDDDGGSSSGSVYVFRYTTSWIQQQKLTANDAASYDHFGYDVSISADGNTIAVGTPWDHHGGGYSKGSVYVFRYTTSWTQQKLTANDAASGDYFGHDVSISADGNTIAVGAYLDGPGRGSVYVFRYNTTSWTQQKLTANDAASWDQFGDDVSISAEGNTIAVGAPYDDDGGASSGSVYVFRYTTSWTQQQKLTANDAASGDYFGQYVSISADGNTIAVGAVGLPYDDDDNDDSGSVYVFRYTTSWTQQQKLTAYDAASWDYFGQDVSISAEGNTIAVGAPSGCDGCSNSGSVYVFVSASAADLALESRSIVSYGADFARQLDEREKDMVQYETNEMSVVKQQLNVVEYALNVVEYALIVLVLLILVCIICVGFLIKYYRKKVIVIQKKEKMHVELQQLKEVNVNTSS